LVRLDLCAPLLYLETPELDPFGIAPPPGEAAEEYLFCFELDREQSRSIEPRPENFLGRLVFSGRTVQNGGDPADNKSGADNVIQMPAGLYLFTQRRRAYWRGAAGREAVIAMAIEQQKDGLWERLRPEPRLFLRLLYEDGGPVTQLFRPYNN